VIAVLTPSEQSFGNLMTNNLLWWPDDVC
jgi:hypothetical protein